MPTTVTSGHRHQGPAQQGLDPDTVTVEQLAMAANFLFAAMDGRGMISQGEELRVLMPGGESLALKARVVGMHMQVEKHMEKAFLFASPIDNPPSPESIMSAGIFLGRLMTKHSELAVGNLTDNKRAIVFKSTKALAKALNACAKEMGDVSLGTDPDNKMSALACLEAIGNMHGCPVERPR